MGKIIESKPMCRPLEAHTNIYLELIICTEKNYLRYIQRLRKAYEREHSIPSYMYQITTKESHKNLMEIFQALDFELL